MTGPDDPNAPRLLPSGLAMQPPEPLPYLEEEGGGLDIRRYIAALLRHKWLIVGLSLAGVAVGAVVAEAVKPIYSVQATIQIDLINQSPAASSPIRESQLLQNRGWLDLVRSFAVLEEVVRRRRLYLEHSGADDLRYFEGFEVAERFMPGRYTLRVNAAGDRVSLLNREDSELENLPVGDSIGRNLGFRWLPTNLSAGLELHFTVRTPRDAAVRLSQAIDVPQIGVDASFLNISLRGTNPVEITETVNAIAKRFVEVGAFLKRDKLTQVTEVLGAQLERAQRDLRNAENSLETFRINTITLQNDPDATPIATGLAETRAPVSQAFFRLKLDRDSLDMERNTIRRALSAADSNVSLLVSLGSVPAARNSAELGAALDLLASKRVAAREMRIAFGPAHRPLQELDREIAELESTVLPSLARGLAASLDQRISDLGNRIDASGREMQQIPARVSEESRQVRNVSIANTLYTQLQAAFEQARLAELSAAPDVRLLDEAKVPLEPVTDQKRIILAGGLAAGVALGLLLAILLDRFDKRIRYPDQVTRELGLTILGTLPLLNTDKRGGADPDAAAQLLESTRSIRMNLAYAHGTAGTFITTITSPGPGDGKSFTSANLARAFAGAGRRTLLIDADTRRGILHRSLGVDRKPGLIDYLRNEADRSEVIRPLPDLGIDFLPCGTRHASGPELLASPRMAQFLLSLRGEYQAIIVDSPPLGAGVDPLILASLCGSMVLVLRSGVTDRELTEARLQDLKRLPIRLLGAILNDVRSQGAYRYYGYLPGYRAEDEGMELDMEVATTGGPTKTKRLKGA